MMMNYIGTKFVQAEPELRNSLKCGDRTMIVPLGFKPSPEWIAANGFEQTDTFTIENVEGYKVRYADGYESWSPKDTFEEAYRSVMEGMDFGMALTCLKAGFRVTRSMWIIVEEGENFRQSKVTAMLAYRTGYTDIALNEGTTKAFKMMPGKHGDVEPYIQGVRDDGVLFVYTPTVDDLLAEDWRVLFEDDAEISECFKEATSDE